MKRFVFFMIFGLLSGADRTMAIPAAPSGLLTLHRSGQTFLSWTEVSGSGTFYRDRRLLHPTYLGRSCHTAHYQRPAGQASHRSTGIGIAEGITIDRLAGCAK